MNQDLYSQISRAWAELPEYSPVFEKLHSARSYEDRYRTLLKIGQSYPNFEVFRADEFLVKGCQSKAWLWSCGTGETWVLGGDSESKLVRALLVLVMIRVKALALEERRSFQFESWIQELQLERHISSSRMGGLGALILKIKTALV